MPLLTVILLGGVIGYLLVEGAPGAGVATPATASWPPDANVQAGLLAQIEANYQAQFGQPMTSDMISSVSDALATAPGHYVDTLPAGTAPTIPGYQAWALGRANAAMGGIASVQPTTQGFLGSSGGNPYPTWTAEGNAWFVNEHGDYYHVWNARDRRGDYLPPNWVPGGVVADFEIR